MKRTSPLQRTEPVKKLVSAILTSDWHLREDQPQCRTDAFWVSQFANMDIVKALQTKFNCPVIHAGDLFHHWKPSPVLLTETMKHIPLQFHTVYGQHDLPQHNLDLSFKCGVNTLEEAGVLTVLEGMHWGQKLDEDDNIKNALRFDRTNKYMLVWHHLVCKSRADLWPGNTASEAKRLLERYPEFDIILTGDNHQPFVETVEAYGGRHLVNPGCFTQQKVSERDYKPRVYLWCEDDNSIEPVYLPYNPDVITREHIEHKEKRDERIDAFISKLSTDWDSEVSFEQNLNKFYSENTVGDPIKQIIAKAMDEGV